MTGPEDERAAAVGGRGHLRASRTDRERVIELLKAAFVEERLDKDEFEARVVQAFASRTYAELAAVTANIPAGLPVAVVAAVESAAAAPAVVGPTSTPARTLAKAAFRACLCVLVSTALVGVAFLTQNPVLMFFAVYAVPWAAIAVSGFLGYGVIDAWQQRRSRPQLRSGPGLPDRPGEPGAHPARRRGDAPVRPAGPAIRRRGRAGHLGRIDGRPRVLNPRVR
jgi:Domain of unknown function (DUF1707)